MSGCVKCGRSYPEVRVDVYWGPSGSQTVCDPCLDAEIREQYQPRTVAYRPGARYLVNRDGSESEYPSYES